MSGSGLRKNSAKRFPETNGCEGTTSYYCPGQQKINISLTGLCGNRTLLCLYFWLGHSFLKRVPRYLSVFLSFRYRFGVVDNISADDDYIRTLSHHPLGGGV